MEINNIQSIIEPKTTFEGRGISNAAKNLTQKADSFEMSTPHKNVQKNLFVRFFDKIKSFFVHQKQEKSLDKIEVPLKPQNAQVSFKGINVSNTKSELLKEVGLTEQQAGQILSELGEKAGLDEISSMLELNNISPKEFAMEVNRQKELFDGEIEFALSQTIENLKFYPLITEENMFSPFKLNFDEVSRIVGAITEGNIGDIYDILNKNNPEIGKMFSKDQILERNFHSIYQKMALKNYVLINSDDLIDLGKMNGKDKKIIFPSSTGISPVKTIDMDPKTLIKSNLITMELLEATKDIPLPKEKKLKAITSQKIVLNPEKIREKALKFGTDCLSTYEIHALTDCMTDEPKILDEAKKIINNTSNPTNKQIRQLLGYAEHLKKLAQPVLNGSKVKIDDHAFLRMIDRNMVSVADNQQGRLLSFPELLSVIKNAAESELSTVSPKEEIIIQGYKNGSGIKLLLNYNPDGTCTVDSIM